MNTKDKRIADLEAQVGKLRLERDMLALNPQDKDPAVFILTNETGDVLGVAWKDPSQQTGSDRAIRFPSYYEENK